MNKQEILNQLTNHAGQIRQLFSVKELSIFGSVARDQADENSDVDLLVEFDKKADFDSFMDLKFYLEDLLGTRIDLVTRNALRPRLSQLIEQELIHVA